MVKKTGYLNPYLTSPINAQVSFVRSTRGPVHYPLSHQGGDISAHRGAEQGTRLVCSNTKTDSVITHVLHHLHVLLCHS